ncbi:MAG: dienelactone hydrolase family protein [Actinomycetes bacterium]
MCHDHGSRPPAPPRTGDVRERGVLTLTSADGAEFSAAYAAPSGRARAGVVVLPDIRGLHPYYVALAERFAQAGLVAVAIDCFGGSHSWRQSGGSLDLAGCAGFYGRPSLVGEAATRAHLPTVMLIAGADQVTPVEDQLRLADTMRSAGADVDAVVYDGAPHSFFDRSSAEWDDACRDAWEHLLALTDRVSEPERRP